jgi:hypothetical protein
MKKNLIIGVLAFCTISVYAQKSASPRQVLNNQLNEWNKGNIQGFMSGYWQNDSLQFLTSKGITYGWESVTNNYKKSYPTKEKMGNLDFEILSEKKIDKKHTMIIGKWKVKDAEGENSGYFSLLFKLIDGNWKLILDHTS